MATELLHPKVDPTIEARKLLTKWYYNKYPTDDCFVPHLEDWLAAMGDKVIKTVYQAHNDRFACYVVEGEAFYFGHDGNPLYEPDYQAFCDVMNDN